VAVADSGIVTGIVIVVDGVLVVDGSKVVRPNPK
jgi:hypothetical protein